ncbi:NUDIX hydrolase [Candidatus Woesearchaeota archaeon]|nr:NUDIX hydrolase [Candidatus Woesearchaeota archaeon]
MTKWKTLTTQYLEKNNWIALRKESCITQTGKKIDEYYVMEIQDVSCVIAITKEKEEQNKKEKKVVLVKEYKHGVQHEILQLPCGYIDKGEEPFAAAKRELQEETGYTSKKWTPLGKFAGSPGRLTHYYHFFLAEECEKTSEPKLDELETLSVFEYSWKDAEEQLKKQNTDLVTPLGLALAKKVLEN